VPDWTGEPAYRQLAESLRGRIRSGELPVGEQLPSQAALMRDNGVSSSVVRMAISELRAEGLIATHQGKGVFVRAVPGAAAATSHDEIQTRLGDLTLRVAALEADMKQLRAKR
jgi:GntR family transcriptional regulator